MTIEIIQFEINNNLVKVQKKVQCLVCVQVTHAHTHEKSPHKNIILNKNQRDREKDPQQFLE